MQLCPPCSTLFPYTTLFRSSWSKWVIFSRRWWSCSSTGPRRPALREWSVSRSRAPVEVVSWVLCWARSRCSGRSEEHTSELQSRGHLVCRLLLEKKKRPLDRGHH